MNPQEHVASSHDVSDPAIDPQYTLHSPPSNHQNYYDTFPPQSDADQPSRGFYDTLVPLSPNPQSSSFSLFQCNLGLLSHPPDYSNDLGLAQTFNGAVSDAAQNFSLDSAFSPYDAIPTDIYQGSRLIEDQSIFSGALEPFDHSQESGSTDIQSIFPAALEPFGHPLPNFQPLTDFGGDCDFSAYNQTSGLTNSTIEAKPVDMGISDHSIDTSCKADTDDTIIEFPRISRAFHSRATIKATGEERADKRRTQNKLAQRRYRQNKRTKAAGSSSERINT